MFLPRLRRFTILLALLTMVLPAQAQDDKSKRDEKSKHIQKNQSFDGKPILWHERGNISSLNLLLGPAKEEMKPDISKVTFIREETEGWSKKYRVRDGSGREWVAKIGVEAQPETAATRLLWATGYDTDITFLVPSVVIDGKGTFKNVRFEARDKNIKRVGEWQWDHNPFAGTMELQGLKIMMILIGNWDIKDTNNRILRVANEQAGDVELRYIVSDLGATLGKTGGVKGRSRNEPADYVKTKFIKGVKNNRVEFNYNGKRKELFQDITVEQAKWLGNMLSRLNDEQIADAFRAANYSPTEVQMLTAAFRGRINELNALPGQPRAAKERTQ
jgi:hypothetical protein